MIMSGIFFLGAGKMATAICGGLVKSGLYEAGDLAAFDVSDAAGKAFSQATGVSIRPLDAVEDAEALLIAVKPQMIEPALQPLAGKLGGKLVISIAAGVPIAKISSLTGARRVVRVMPNTPALVGAGAAAYAPGPDASAEDAALVGRILGAVGIAYQVKESDLDAVTGLSGSGPAYAFEFIQALADGGVAEGLPRDTAKKLAAQTLLGAAKMVLESDKHPNELCDAVTSPAGTTSRGLELLAERAFHAAVMQAVRAASRRSRELGK
jgi:pyrroline-5-carboxylate reductase